MNKGEKTKNRILDVARELFSEKGYTAVTMTAIKEGMGLSIGAVYKYFPSIKDIYLAILARDEATAKEHTQSTDSMTGEQILAYALERNYDLAIKQQLGWVVAMYEFMLCEDDYKSTMQERFDSCIEFNKAMIAMEVSDFGDEELRQRALLLFNYMNGFQLTATNYLFTKEDIVQQLKLLRKLLFER